MTTRLRDWVIVAVVLTAVFGVTLRAPRPQAGEESASAPAAAPRGTGYSPAAVPDAFPPRPRVPRTEPPFLRIDPKPMILYTRPPSR